MSDPLAITRQERRRERTRAALVSAARSLLASRDPAEISVQDVTDVADVGLGSFYNYFQTKLELFDFAVDEVLTEQGALLDAFLADTADAAERFGTGVRLAGRLPLYHPQMADIMLRIGVRHVDSSNGIGPRALRDLKQAKRDGRLRFRDAQAALYTTVGALTGVGHYAAQHPHELERVVDDLALQLLQAFCLPTADARRIVRRRLPPFVPNLPPPAPH